MMNLFRPKLIDTLKGYTPAQFYKDVVAGIIVGVVALPLAIAFAIASGVSPEKGIFTAIIAGVIISALGGSKVQIGGPTGAFIVVVYGIVQQFGVSGLVIATFIAGIILIIMGVAKLGNTIKYIPYPLVIGFTTGIAVIIFSSEVKDFLGLKMGNVPADFISKWIGYSRHLSSLNLYALFIGVFTLLVVLLWPRVTRKVPGSLIAIVISTLLVRYFHLPVETIGSRFGVITAALPHPVMPDVSLETIRQLIRPAFTIALLCSIESLLSAVVADGMTGGNHRSNTELIAQGVANICSSVLGGIPATGAIARTATNIKNGGSTPVAGIIHAIALLLIMLFIGQWAALIPMATLAGILVVVAWNMSELENFIDVFKGSKSDASVLLITFGLTILVDLTVAIEIGIILAAFLFMRKMMQSSSVQQTILSPDQLSDDEFNQSVIPKGVDVFEINGPLFFGAAYKFKDTMKVLEKPARVLIIRMRNVPVIDATGIRVLRDVHQEIKKKGTKLILSEANSEQVTGALKKTRLLFQIGKGNVRDTFEKALKRADEVLSDTDPSKKSYAG
ncbi:STAS domain-containing protein [Mucilaginibacter rubeus]|uniref:STAS domain-containing protein n=3 Tax=Mucilaginibacter rubeus TaxID=2027860 RepID=A0ABX7ULQ6_9SPHI|nr:STAS domain-containing protein [Mucilaginibacter rubeus]QTE53677.1 STAS domain-containing protein [Mucilaginibacter rubeus]QTE60177.1 STAS domain-containing protein [Mucilaginibacter rubeus]QTE66891.1 STAS domain-containing protein [Mucilaginibacter rubeus]QTF65704.1 STAS domain-containing protein [Mucilaginibacter rubeus]